MPIDSQNLFRRRRARLRENAGPSCHTQGGPGTIGEVLWHILWPGRAEGQWRVASVCLYCTAYILSAYIPSLSCWLLGWRICFGYLDSIIVVVYDIRIITFIIVILTTIIKVVHGNVFLLLSSFSCWYYLTLTITVIITIIIIATLSSPLSLH